jgi:hypothetical protein
MRKTWIWMTATVAVLTALTGTVCAETTLKEFRQHYPLAPVRSYTFLGTEKSVQQLWIGRQNDHSDKPCVEPDGSICGWFDPGNKVPWVKEAMKTGAYDFGLVDGYLPAVHYIYHKAGGDATCEMTAFAVDSTVPGAIFIHVALVEKEGREVKAARYLKLGDEAPSSQAVFESALRGIRERWTAFFARGAQIRIDDPEVMLACKASIIRALITFTGKRPHYGVRSYGPGQSYGAEYGDGFPPTVISLMDCLVDWGQASLAREYLTAYFDIFVQDNGRIKYYNDPRIQGCSVAEYGQLLCLARRCMDAPRCREWFEHLRPKLDRIRAPLWDEQARSPSGLIPGAPEADRREQIGIYFHNNGWAWRGLRDIAPLLGHEGDAARCESFGKIVRAAIDKAANRSVTPMFIPPMPEKTPFNIMTPFETMTESDFASYTNYRYWPELLSSGILSREQMEAVIAYRNTHGGEIAGLGRIWGQADNWPIAEYAAGLRALGRMDEVRRILYSHLAGHTTPETWTAYEEVAITGSPYRAIKADYCVPAQLVAPRLAAWLWKAQPTAQAFRGDSKAAEAERSNGQTGLGHPEIGNK